MWSVHGRRCVVSIGAVRKTGKSNVPGIAFTMYWLLVWPEGAEIIRKGGRMAGI